MAGTRISTRLKKPTEKAAAQPHRITKARTRSPRSKPSPKKSKKRKLAVSESSDNDLVDDSDDSIVTAAHTLGKKAASKAASKSDRAHRKSNPSASIEVVELEIAPQMTRKNQMTWTEVGQVVPWMVKTLVNLPFISWEASKRLNVAE